jgi:FkbM family methyltransferase
VIRFAGLAWKTARWSTTPVRTFVGLWMTRVGVTASDWSWLFKFGTLMMRARSLDLFAIQEVLIDREYDTLGRFLRRHPSPTVLDLGANVGAFAAFVFDLCPEAEVQSVEPSPDTFALLDENRRRNPSFRWDAVHAAVWIREGTVSFASAGPSTGRRLVIAPSAHQVPAVTLDTLLTRLSRRSGRVNVLKIDIEGAEGAVLAATGSRLHLVDVLIVEIHPPEADEASVRRLLSEWFNVIETIPGRASAKPVLVAYREDSVATSDDDRQSPVTPGDHTSL